MLALLFRDRYRHAHIAQVLGVLVSNGLHSARIYVRDANSPLRRLVNVWSTSAIINKCLMGKLKCNWYFTHDQHCTMQKPTAVKGSMKGKLTESNYTSSYNLICFLVESCCLVAEVENTKANNFIAVPNDSNLMDNVQTISWAISVKKRSKLAAKRRVYERKE